MKVVAVFLILLMPVAVWATKNRRPIAVAYPILPDGKISKRMMRVVTAQFRTALANSGIYRVVDKANQNKILREQRECRRRWYSSACRIEVGRLLSAAKMVTGTLMKMEGQSFYLTLVVTDLTKGLEEQRSSEMCRNCDTMRLLGVVDRAVARLIGQGLPPRPRIVEEVGRKSPVRKPRIRKERKRLRLKEALVLLDRNRTGAALKALRKIYDRSPRPALHLPMGNCYLKLKRYGRAVKSFQRYLSIGSLLPSAQRWKAKRLLKEARRGFDRTAGKLVVDTTPAGAEVRTADGELLGQSRQVIRLGPGWHELRVSKSGYLTVKRRIRITTGRSESVQIKLKRGFHHKNQFLLGVDGASGYVKNSAFWQLHVGIGLGKVVDLCITIGGGIGGGGAVFLVGLESRFYFLTGRYKPYFIFDIQFGTSSAVDEVFAIFGGGGLQIEASRHVGFFLEFKLGGHNFNHTQENDRSNWSYGGGFDVAIRLGVQFRI